MNFPKADHFSVYGLVMPSEWQWKKEFKAIAMQQRKFPMAYVRLDVCKILGLVKRLDELERKFKKLNKEHSEK